MSSHPLNIVFLGSPEVAASVLKELCQLEDGSYKIKAVVTQNAKKSGRKNRISRTPVALAAEQLGVPLLETENTSNEESLAWLKTHRPDVMITAAFGQFLRKSFLDFPSLGTINLHPSLLPKYRGASPVQSALWNGDQTSGITILYTVSKMDAGNIIWQSASEVAPNECSPDLLERLFLEGARAVPDCLQKVKNQYKGTSQAEEKITHCKKIKKQDALIDFSTETAAQVICRFRAFQPWPGLYCFIRGQQNQKPLQKRIVFKEIAFIDIPTSDDLLSGQVRWNGEHSKLELALSQNSILIEEMQIEGKKTMPAEQLWKSYFKQIQNLEFFSLATELETK